MFTIIYQGQIVLWTNLLGRPSLTKKADCSRITFNILGVKSSTRSLAHAFFDTGHTRSPLPSFWSICTALCTCEKQLSMSKVRRFARSRYKTPEVKALELKISETSSFLKRDNKLSWFVWGTWRLDSIRTGSIRTTWHWDLRVSYKSTSTMTGGYQGRRVMPIWSSRIDTHSA